MTKYVLLAVFPEFYGAKSGKLVRPVETLVLGSFKSLDDAQAAQWKQTTYTQTSIVSYEQDQ